MQTTCGRTTSLVILVAGSPAADDVVAGPHVANPGPQTANNARRMANRPFMMQVDQLYTHLDGGGFDGGGLMVAASARSGLPATRRPGDSVCSEGAMTMETTEWRLHALSPLDGRYGKQMEPYAAAFSEAALIRERFGVEVAWLEVSGDASRRR